MQKPSASSRIVVLSAIVALFMIAQQIASKAVRDGFFLSHFDMTALPVATLVSAVASFVAALFMGKFISTFSPAAAVPVLFATNGVLFFTESAFAQAMPRVVAAALYLHVAAFGGAVVSGFWSVINERFDPYTARKVMGRIAGGATFGGVLGGVLTWLFSDVAPRYLLAGFGIGSLLCTIAIAAIAKGPSGRPKAAPQSAALLAGVHVLVQESYPRAIGIVVFLGALMTGIVDYVFKAGVAASTPTSSLVGFFAIFYTVVGIVTFVVQAVGSSRVLKWLGVVFTAGLFPAATVILLIEALLVPGLVSLVWLRGGAMVAENSLYRSGYELLYTAVPSAQKRSAKVLIDLGCDRLGTAAASGLTLLILALTAVYVDRMLLLTAMTVALGILAMLVIVRREYIASLAHQLRKSAGEDQTSALDPAVQLAATFVAETHLWDGDLNEDVAQASMTKSLRVDVATLRDQVSRRAQVKTNRAPERAAKAHPKLVSKVSERLLDTPLRARLRDAADLDVELRQSAPATIGQLGDILLSQREDLEVRLRAAELLADVPSPRAVDALLEVLTVPQLRLRRAGALALLQICTASPGLRPPRRRLVELAGEELKRPGRPIGARNPFEQSSPFLTDARGNELSASLEQVFLLLAIGSNTEELRLALTAITSEDATQRGTGLEFLDNLLPTDLRARLLALAEHPELTQADQRVPQPVMDDLAKQLRGRTLDVSTLRKKFKEARKLQYDQRS